MDPTRFDALSRSLADGHSRRGLTRVLGGLTLGLFGWQHVEDILAADAKKCKKIKDKAKRKKCLKKAQETDSTPTEGGLPVDPGTTSLQPDPSTTTPPPITCPSGQKPCGGRCIPSDQCCTNSDCPDFRPHCQGGVCGCPPERPLTCSTGGGPPTCQEQCCQLTDCPGRASGSLGGDLNGRDGLQCLNGRCVCTTPGTRYCGGSIYQCDFCCSNDECAGRGGQICFKSGGTQSRCACPQAQCEGVCIAFACSGRCFEPCPTLTAGQPCCPADGGGVGLICTQVTDTQRYCLPAG